jgi:hypothetical protein
VFTTGASPLAPLKAWDVRARGTAPFAATGGGCGVFAAVAAHPALAERVACGGADGTVRVYDLRAPAAPLAAFATRGAVRAVEWHPATPQLLLCGGDDGRAVCVDVSGGGGAAAVAAAPLFEVDACAHFGGVGALAFDPRENVLVGAVAFEECAVVLRGAEAMAGGAAW